MDNAINDLYRADDSKAIEHGLQELSAALTTISPEISLLNSIAGDHFAAAMKAFDHDAKVSLHFAQEGDQIAIYGVNIYQDIKKMVAEWKAHQYTVFAQTLDDIVKTLIQALSNFKSMSKVVKGLQAVDTQLTEGIQVENIMKDTWPQLKHAFVQLLDGYGSGNTREELLGFADVANVIEALAGQVETADPTIGKGIKAIAKYFKTEIAIINYGKDVIIAGTDCSDDFTKARACWQQKDYTCVGQEIGNCMTAIKTNMPESTWVKDLVAALAETQRAVVLTADAKVTYDDFDAAVLAFHGAHTPAEYKTALTKLATAIQSVNADLEQLDDVLYNKIDKLVQKLENDVTITVAAEKKFMIGGVNIWQTVDDTVQCWHPESGDKQDDVKCIVANIKKLINEIKGLEPSAW